MTVGLDAHEEELIHVHLMYTASNPVLDGRRMNTLFRVIDEPIRASGITARTLVRYTDVNDPTLPECLKPPRPPASAP